MTRICTCGLLVHEGWKHIGCEDEIPKEPTVIRMKFAYADPPYIGCGHRYPEKAEVDHAELITRLVKDYPDGWALSCSSPSLWEILPLCPKPPACRVMAWVKPFAVFKPNVNPAYAWEPVIVMGGRKRGRDMPTLRDWHSANITLKKGLVGAKPQSFCEWVCAALNIQKGDELHDLFPGTGIMGNVAQALLEANGGR